MCDFPLLTDGPQEAATTLVLAHGAGAPMDSPFMEALAGRIAARGHRVVRFEFAYMAERRTTGRKRPPERAPALLEQWRAVIARLGGPGMPVPRLSGPSAGQAGAAAHRSLPGSALSDPDRPGHPRSVRHAGRGRRPGPAGHPAGGVGRGRQPRPDAAQGERLDHRAGLGSCGGCCRPFSEDTVSAEPAPPSRYSVRIALISRGSRPTASTSSRVMETAT